MDDVKKIVATLVYCEHVSSYDGVGRFKLVLTRKMEGKALGRTERIEIDLSIARSDLGCLVQGMRKFAKRERDAIKETIDYIGVDA